MAAFRCCHLAKQLVLLVKEVGIWEAAMWGIVQNSIMVCVKIEGTEKLTWVCLTMAILILQHGLE